MTKEPAKDHDFAQVWILHKGMLWRSLYTFTGGDRGIADEALSEAFARAIEHADDIREPLPWIYRTALRIARTEMKRRQQTGGSDDMDWAAPAKEVGLLDLVEALRELPANQRTAIVLHYEEDLPVGRISELMGVRPATVKVHLYRGRRALRRTLSEEQEEEDD